MTEQLKIPMTLEYQSRIIKAKRVAIGGLTLLGGGIVGIAMLFFFFGIAEYASMRGAGFPGRVLSSLPFMGIFFALGTLGFLMLICAYRIKRNHLRAARMGQWLVGLLFLPVVILFGFLFNEHRLFDQEKNDLVIVPICALAVCSGLVAVLVELAKVKNAILRGEYEPAQPRF